MSFEVDVKKLSFMGNECLRKYNTEIEYTDHELSEVVKCAKDPIYFIENYCQILGPKGPQLFKLYEYQKKFIMALHNGDRIIVKWPRQSGKCSSFLTKLEIQNDVTGEIKSQTIGDLFNELDKH